MSKKKKVFLIAFSVSAIIALLVPLVSPWISGHKKEDGVAETDRNETKKLTEEEQEELIVELKDMVAEGYKPTEIEKKLTEILPLLDEEHSTRAVREFMNSIEETSMYFGQLLYTLGGELFYSISVDGIEDPVKEHDKLSNRLAKGYIEEMLRQYLKVRFIDSFLYIEPDARYVLDRFGKYTKGDYKDYLNLLAKQMEEPIFDDEKEMYDVDRLAEDLLYIENARDRWEDGEFAQDWLELERQLYEAFFAYSHATFFDEEIENEGTDEESYKYILKPEIREKYEQIMLSNKDTQLAKDIEAFLGVLDETNNVVNDKVDEYLTKAIDDRFGGPHSGGDEAEGEVEEKADESQTDDEDE